MESKKETKFQYLSLEQLKKFQTHVNKKPLFSNVLSAALPAFGSVKNMVPEIYNQQNNDCVANAVALSYRMTEKDKTFIPSRRYIYYKTRLVEDNNDPNLVQDEGSNPSDSLDFLKSHGVCSESTLPYLSDNVNVIPNSKMDLEALNHTIKQFYQLPANNLQSVKQAILRGVPVIVGVACYESFESSHCLSTGVIPMPNVKNEQFLGGHEMLICGYYDKPQLLTLANSWGSSVGHNGFFYLPYSYLTNSNFTWSLLTIEKGF